MEHKIQGDIIFLKVNKIPDNLNFRPLKKEGEIIAVGETTGHRHQVLSRPDSRIEIVQDEKGFYLKVLEGEAEVIHEKHPSFILPPAIWRIRRQREYTELGKWRQVSD